MDNDVLVVIYFGGQTMRVGRYIIYTIPAVQYVHMSRSCTYEQLISRMCYELNVDRCAHWITVQGTIRGVDMDILKAITCDRDVTEMFGHDIQKQSVDVFVDAYPLGHAGEGMSQGDPDWGSYANLLMDGMANFGGCTHGFQSMSIGAEYFSSMSPHGEGTSQQNWVEETVDNIDNTAEYGEDFDDDEEEGDGDDDNAEDEGAGDAGDDVEHGASTDTVVPESDEVYDMNPMAEASLDRFADIDTGVEGEYMGPTDTDDDNDDDEGDNGNEEDETEINEWQELLSQRETAVITSTAVQPGPSGHASSFDSIPFFSRLFGNAMLDMAGVSCSETECVYNSSVGELRKGMLFRSKAHLITSVQEYSILHVRWEYSIIKSRPTLWVVKCQRLRSTGCRWRLWSTYQRKSTMWKIKNCPAAHTCMLNELQKTHSNLGQNVVAAMLIGHVRQNSNVQLKYVQELVQEKYKYEILYDCAWRGLRAAHNEVYGTWEESVAKLPRYLKAIQQANTGTVVDWCFYDTKSEHVKIIKYIFWLFGPCIEGIPYCRPVICVDGTHLYMKFKHKLLIAIAGDANNEVFSLAFVLVNEETIESWTWFLRTLAWNVLGKFTEIYLISDRHAGIRSAVVELPIFKHRYCLRHLRSNFNKQFRNDDLKELCWKAGIAHSTAVHLELMNTIKHLNEDAYNWLSRIDKEKWTMSHDGRLRYGVMTTNLAESYNNVLKGARKLPITAIVVLTFNRIVQYFILRKDACTRMRWNNQQWADYAFKKVKAYLELSKDLYTTIVDMTEMTVTVSERRPGVRQRRDYVVRCRPQTCTCGLCSRNKIPCSHAIAACVALEVLASSYVDVFYDVRHYEGTYMGQFEPPIPEDDWPIDVGFKLLHDPRLRRPRGPGRLPTLRIENEMDWPENRASGRGHGRRRSRQRGRA